MELGEKIKSYRIENKITQKELADMVGVSRTNIAEIEGGRVKGTLKFINKLSEATNKSLGYWTGDVNSDNIAHKQYEALDILIDAMITTGSIASDGKIIDDKSKELLIAILEKEIKLKLEKIKEGN